MDFKGELDNPVNSLRKVYDQYRESVKGFWQVALGSTFALTLPIRPNPSVLSSEFQHILAVFFSLVFLVMLSIRIYMKFSTSPISVKRQEIKICSETIGLKGIKNE
ncbi:MAG: hypothetical protein QXQ64_03020 [Candidatus Bathyarchaeia archaeon]